MEEVEEELRKIHSEDGLEEPELKFDQHSNAAEVMLEEEREQVQDTGSADHIIEHEEENLFTYEGRRRRQRVPPKHWYLPTSSHGALYKEAGDIKLPSSLWAMHKDPNGRFIAFSRLPANRTGRLIADKGVVFAESLVPAVFFREMKLKLPPGVPTQPLESLHQVSVYLQKIHRLAFCTGTGLHDPARSMKCRIYVDMPSSVRRCTACNAQQQAVLFAAQEKKT